MTNFLPTPEAINRIEATLGRILYRAAPNGNARYPASGKMGTECASIEPSDLEKARAIYRARQARSDIFWNYPTLFAEPSWDILLDLFVAELSGDLISITSCCIASHVPATTALRCIAQLENNGLVIRHRDNLDRRRFYVRPSANAMELMRRTLANF